MKKLLIIILLFPVFLSALPLFDAYEVIPIDAQQGMNGDYWHANTISENGIILGYQGTINQSRTHITNLQPKIWTVPGKKVNYLIPEQNKFITFGDNFGPRANRQDILIYRDRQTVHVYKPRKTKKTEIQLKNLGDVILDFDDQGNLYIQGYTRRGGTARGYKADAYIQNISDPTGNKRQPLSQETADRLYAENAEKFYVILRSKDLPQEVQTHIINPDWRITAVIDFNRQGQLLVYAVYEGQHYLAVLNPLK